MNALSTDPATSAGRRRHASPFHCPYCGETDLFPHDSEAGSGWECRACLRAFSVSFLTQIRPEGGPR